MATGDSSSRSFLNVHYKVFNLYTNFSMEAIKPQFNTSVRFKADTNLTLHRTGDLIFYTSVLINLKGITACTAGTTLTRPPRSRNQRARPT